MSMEHTAMTESILGQLLPYESFAIAFVEGKFGHREVSPVRVVQDVLAGYIGKPPRLISNPKRFLLRACRLRALQVYGGRRRDAEPRPTLEGILQRRRDEASELLVALEEHDRSKFFGTKDEGDNPGVEVSATLEFPAASVRMHIRFNGNPISTGAA